MNHTVKVIHCNTTYKKKGGWDFSQVKRDFTAIVDGMHIIGTFILRIVRITNSDGHDYNSNRDYAFRFPKGCLITKQKDWKDIRLQILEGCIKIIEGELDLHLLRSTNAPRISKGTSKG